MEHARNFMHRYTTPKTVASVAMVIDVDKEQNQTERHRLSVRVTGQGVVEATIVVNAQEALGNPDVFAAPYIDAMKTNFDPSLAKLGVFLPALS